MTNAEDPTCSIVAQAFQAFQAFQALQALQELEGLQRRGPSDWSEGPPNAKTPTLVNQEPCQARAPL